MSTIRFGHIADCHLGSFSRERPLWELNMLAFERAVDTCIQENVAFILFAGDLFHTSIPEMTVVKRAASKLQEARSAGITLFFIYGSHDYSHDGHSIADVLTTIRFVEDVMVTTEENGTIKLGFTEDAATGAKITGISGRRNGTEVEIFQRLDRVPLQTAGGLKIFMYHSAVKDILSEFENSVPIEHFPGNFAYYAGGHCHKHLTKTVPGYGCFAYPGPLFGCDLRDLERTVNEGEARGFYIVEADETAAKPTFVPIEVATIVSVAVACDGLKAEDVEQKVKSSFEGRDLEGRVVLLRLRGVLAKGIRLADVDLQRIRQSLIDAGAVSVNLQTSDLSSLRSDSFLPADVGAAGLQIDDIETAAFKTALGDVAPDDTLGGENGVALARNLLSILRQSRLDTERNNDVYQDRIVEECMSALDTEAKL